MSKSGLHPETFQISIDHNKLCRYLRLQAILVTSAFFIFFGSLFGFASCTENKTDGEFVIYCLLRVGVGASIGLAIALFLYFVLYHFPSKRQADSVQLRVEGQFLRAREGFLFRRDRKLHFSAIVDYTCFDGPLMRWCGIAGIAMTTMAGGQSGILKIAGVKDTEKVRDVLSEIDRQRQNMSPDS